MPMRWLRTNQSGLLCGQDLIIQARTRALIQHRTNLRKQRRCIGVLPPIVQVEGVIKIGRVLALVVLQDGFELVQRLDGLGLG